MASALHGEGHIGGVNTGAIRSAQVITCLVTTMMMAMTDSWSLSHAGNPQQHCLTCRR